MRFVHWKKNWTKLKKYCTNSVCYRDAESILISREDYMPSETNKLVRYKTGEGKQRSHAYLNKKYNLAMKHGFYFEAIMISYNLVEDRLIAILHYAGVVSRDSEKLSVTRRVKQSIRNLLHKEERQGIKIYNIEEKLNILDSFINTNTDDEYIMAVKDQLVKANCVDELNELIKECRKWKEVRNKYVHGLANKSLESVEQLAAMIAEQGMQIARGLDNCVGRFSRKNNIRKRFRIQ